MDIIYTGSKLSSCCHLERPSAYSPVISNGRQAGEILKISLRKLLEMTRGQF